MASLCSRGWRSVVIALFALMLAAAVQGRPLTFLKSRECYYNRTLALYMVEYASAVYIQDELSLLSWSCSRCGGLTTGFKIRELVIDNLYSLQAFVGVAEDLKAIVIAVRGTQESSLQNWAEDLFFKQLDLNYPGVTDAMVHSGFYTAYHNSSLRPGIIDAVEAIQRKRKDLSFMVTGHSMGGAVASFCALDLAVNFGQQNMEVVTFGQPRIGNSVFAAYYRAMVPSTIRMTHANDLVPHLPPYYSLMAQKTYHHFATEVWIYRLTFGILSMEFERICDSSGEDPTCSRSVKGNSISDHLVYLGVQLCTELRATSSS
eukprot:TRINITY_DN9991_c0_g1_i1.p1 TRINITY_DN9991_c0_g1~~TRINITY_DN9991_c0_g1_i1.p1  ORF type:complete len:317 (-),score=21.71 TRINITY_DN9991_c0_g1_i1:195-1145(-)